MAYSELIKNFEKIRAYMREFYIYGFKSRNEYNSKSARSYDDERRRIESWLGDYMRFTQTAAGKKVFLSIDSRVTAQNPLYKAWKSKSFTDGDITLHFILFDILYSPEIRKTLSELVEETDDYLCGFENPITFDESTIRKKLREYTAEGIILTEKQGRRVLYSRAPDIDISALSDAIDFFSEAAPCGVIGSFLRDRQGAHESIFSFKHHYITQAIDSDILALLFDAMRKKCFITAVNYGNKPEQAKELKLVPLKIYISVQSGRQNLIAYHVRANRLNSYRIDYLSDIKICEPCEKFDSLRKALEKSSAHTWGVNCKWNLRHLERVEFDIKIADDEQFIIQRLEREKRCGTVEKLDENNYRFTAEVFDTAEMFPWIRTFISRITRLNFSNRTAENRFKADLLEMYKMYGIEEVSGNNIQ